MSPEKREQSEALYEEHLEPAKAHLKELIKQLCVSIQSDKEQQDRMKWFLRIIKHYDSLSLLASIDRNENKDPYAVSLKLCLHDEYFPGEKGFFLTFTKDEALNLVYKLKPEEYLALCEEGLIRMLNAYERRGDPNVFANDISMLQGKLSDVQTAQPHELENIFFYISA